jgi:hypothetical protein
MKIRPPGLVQGYHFAVDNCVVGEITKRVRDLRESLVEVLVVPRVQDALMAVADSNTATAVQLNFVSPGRPFR